METLLFVVAGIVGLQILFMGSRVEAGGVRIRMFGLITLYDNRNLWTEDDVARLARGAVVDIVRRELTSKLEGFLATEDRDEESPDPEDRDLLQRLEAAGFTIIDEDRDLRLTDDGKIEWQRSQDYMCAACGGDMFLLWELYRPTSPAPSTMIGRIKMHSLGHVCGDCGKHAWPRDDPREPIGVIAPYLEEGANFFDVLAHIEEQRRPKEPEPVPASEGSAEAPCEAGEDEAAVPPTASAGAQA